MAEENKVKVSTEDLIPYIKMYGADLKKQMAKAKEKYGVRYNEKNKAAELIRRFGDPEQVPEEYAKEYLLILQKKSTLPASVRYCVRDVCAIAMNHYLFDLQQKQKEGQKENEVS